MTWAAVHPTGSDLAPVLEAWEAAKAAEQGVVATVDAATVGPCPAGLQDPLVQHQTGESNVWADGMTGWEGAPSDPPACATEAWEGASGAGVRSL